MLRALAYALAAGGAALGVLAIVPDVSAVMPWLVIANTSVVTFLLTQRFNDRAHRMSNSTRIGVLEATLNAIAVSDPEKLTDRLSEEIGKTELWVESRFMVMEERLRDINQILRLLKERDERTPPATE